MSVQHADSSGPPRAAASLVNPVGLPATLFASTDAKAERARQLRNSLMQKRQASLGPDSRVTLVSPAATSSGSVVVSQTTHPLPHMQPSSELVSGDAAMVEASPLLVASGNQPAGLGAAVAGAHQALSTLLNMLAQPQTGGGELPAASMLALTPSLVSALASFTSQQLPIEGFRVVAPSLTPSPASAPAVLPPRVPVAVAVPVAPAVVPPASVTHAALADPAVLSAPVSVQATRSARFEMNEDLAALLAEATEAVHQATTRNNQT